MLALIKIRNAWKNVIVLRITNVLILIGLVSKFIQVEFYTVNKPKPGTQVFLKTISTWDLKKISDSNFISLSKILNLKFSLSPMLDHVKFSDLHNSYEVLFFIIVKWHPNQ